MAKAIAKQKVTREAYETALQAYVHNENELSLLVVKRDKEMEKLNAKYDPQFQEFKDEQEVAFAIVHHYCEENRDELFVEAKSIVEFGADLGFREGKEKVVFINETTEKEALALAVKNNGMANYLRTTVALDKVKIIKNKPPQMNKCGIDVIREESFFLEPIKTEVITK